ncbi:MAG TPA: hypothetical protein VHE30_04485 [Polyangiaceae bacterium]|nr:hypothetical protein [Polyangiaceae bacterium]
MSPAGHPQSPQNPVPAAAQATESPSLHVNSPWYGQPGTHAREPLGWIPQTMRWKPGTAHSSSVTHPRVQNWWSGTTFVADVLRQYNPGPHELPSQHGSPTR